MPEHPFLSYHTLMLFDTPTEISAIEQNIIFSVYASHIFIQFVSIKITSLRSSEFT